jgi:hypothetical protein
MPPWVDVKDFMLLTSQFAVLQDGRIRLRRPDSGPKPYDRH